MAAVSPTRTPTKYVQLGKNEASAQQGVVVMADTSQSDGSCGCCQPPPTTTVDVIRELEARRETLDARLAQVGTR